MKHSRVKLFVKADHLTSKADIIHIIFSLVKSWLAFGTSKSFFNHWILYVLLIYHPNCWGQLLSFKWGQTCNILQWNLKKYRIIFGQGMIQFTKYKIQNSTHLSKKHLSDVMGSNCFCTVLFPKRTQLFGIRVCISPNNCVDHVWEKCLPFQYTKSYIFLCERTLLTTV